MTARAEFLWALLAMALASLACRTGGFALMRYVRDTPRVRAAIQAMPIAVMIGIFGPVALSGNPAEILGLLVVMAAARISGSDVFAALCGVAAVAAARAIGF